MKRTRPLVISIVFVSVLVAAVLAAWATGTRPVLGLDLEGGVSVVLTAPGGTSNDVMEKALESIRNRIDALGVAEPQLFVTGNNIEVQIPGLARGTIDPRSKHQFCLVGAAKKSFGCYPGREAANAALQATSVKTETTQVCLIGQKQENLGCFGTQKDADSALKAISVQKPSGQQKQWCLSGTQASTQPCYDGEKEANAAKGAIATKATQQFNIVGKDGRPLATFDAKQAADQTLAVIAVTEENTQYCVIGSQGDNLGCYLTAEDAQARLQQTGQQHLLDIIGTTARLEEREVLSTVTPGTPEYASTPLTCPASQQGTPECSFKALAKKPVTYLGTGGVKYKLGPVQITGDAISKATAVYRTADASATSTSNIGWEVDFELTPDGSKKFADVTTRLTQKQLAIVLDRKVISAPTIQEPITGGSGQITGNFSEQRSKDLATVLNAGALPVELARSQIVTVSPTLGKESLNQGLIAGVAGLIALALYLLFYYRLLGIVTWFGMSIWAVLALGLVALLGRTVGYSLTLAGVAGIIVSMGITADSYIVFYERLKDEVRGGKTPRSAVVPAFKRAWQTIVAADIVTILAAAVLYVLAIGSVRGFALTLGLSTMLDMFVVYFFKRPTVFLIARSPRLTNIHGFGLTSGVAAEPLPGEAEPVPVTGGSR